jgi:hypothetical protein
VPTQQLWKNVNFSTQILGWPKFPNLL